MANTTAAKSNNMQPKVLNFHSFSERPIKSLSSELIQHTSVAFQKHPEFGILPYNTQCNNCFELIEERGVYTRKFLKNNTNGKTTYIQKAYDPLHYKDENGNLRSIDERLIPHPQRPNVFYAPNQEGITEVDLNEKNLKLYLGNEVLVYNQDLRLISVNQNGEEKEIAKANWDNASVGEDGLLVKNIFAGIDMEVLALRGSFKTTFIVQNKDFLRQDAVQFLIRDNAKLPKAYTLKSINNENGIASILLANASGETKFTFHDIVGVERRNGVQRTDYFNYKTTENALDIVIPATWLRNAQNLPVYIDPLVTTSGTLPQASILGSGLNNSGNWVNSCDYYLSVNTPANSTITDILWSFTYIAQNGTPKGDGALTIFLGGCRSPNSTGFFWTCQDPFFGGPCTGTEVSIIGDFTNCLSPPQCSPYNLDFTMNFFDSNGGATCSNTNIGANSDWVMTIEARTVEHPDPILSSNGSNVCLGESTTLTAAGSFGVPPYTYEWTPGNLSGVSVSVSPTVTTNYTVEVTDACNIQATQSFTVNIIGPAAPVVTGNSPVCEGGDIVLTATATDATSYAWSGPAGYNSAQQNPSITNVTSAQAGTYSVEASGAGCTTDPVTIDIVVNPNPTITNVDVVDVPCGGTSGSVDIRAAGTAPFTFDLGNGMTNNTGSFPTLAPATYNFTVEDANSCTVQGTFEVLPDACCAMTNTLAFTAISCDGACDGTITLTEQDGVGAVTFSIDNGNTVQSSGSFTGLCAGTYDILIEDADACTYVNQVVLDNPAALDAQASTVEADCGVCNGSISINVSGGNAANYEYSIDNGISFQAGNTFTGLCPDNYSFVVRDASNCSFSNTILLEEENNTIVLSTNTVEISCNGASDGEIEVIASSNNPPLTYEWNTSDTNPILTGLSAGTYEVTVRDQNNCSKNESIELIEPEAVEVNLGDDIVLCFGESASLSPGTFSSYTWSTGESTASIDLTQSGNYSVTVTDQSNCKGTGSIEVSISDELIVNAGNDTTIESFNRLQLQADINGNRNITSGILWSPSEFLSCNNCLNPVVNLTESQEFVLSYTDPNACVGANTVFINIEEGEYYIYVPNAFTPNNDGINDVFEVYGSGVLEYYLTIHDRWGELVFSSADISETWDGTKNGKEMNPDVFVYYMKVSFGDLSYKTYQGSLQLLK